MAGIFDDPIFMDRLKSSLLSRLNQPIRREGGYTGGPTGPTLPGGFTMSSRTATPEEQQAFTNRNIARAQYGKGGLEGQKIQAGVLSEIAKRQLTPKERADIWAKQREMELREQGKWNWRPDPWGDEQGVGNAEVGTGSAEAGMGQAQAFTGAQIGAAPSRGNAPENLPHMEGTRPPARTLPPATGEAPPPVLLRDVAPAAGTEAPAARPESGGTLRFGDKEWRITPDGRIIRPEEVPQQTAIPTAPAETVTAPPAAAPAVPPGADLQNVSDADLQTVLNAPPSLADTVRAIQGTSPSGARVPKPAPRATTSRPAGPSTTGAIGQTLSDMFYRAPVQAVGKQNLAALANVIADMMYRSPIRSVGQGSEWLSRQVLGGLR